MWKIKDKYTHEVFRVFDTKDEFDLQPAQLVTAGCIFRSVGSATHYAVEEPDSPEIIAARARNQRRGEIIARLEQIDLKSIRALRENNATVIAEYESEASSLRTELRNL